MAINTKIFAHRGASHYAPENTLPSFQLAHEMKADGLELDVQLTKDLVPVIIHDENVRRTTNGRGFVQNYTYNELKQLDAGSWYHKRYKHTPIPSLEEFFKWVQNTNMIINLELKTNVIHYPHIEERVNELINHFKLEDQTVISSFNPETIKRMSEINSNIELAWLTQMKIRKVHLLLNDIGAHGIHIKTRLLTSNMIKRILQEKIPFRVYTVNKVKTYYKCESLNAKAIMTDIPDLIQ
ncbi:glycerophosphodiester phosphodiesterase [Alkalibacillus silvisoli]|uniref:Glycerophosphodiester phosphodiesterase n=1 Tax=Alkalibacillus silvisoli TaxID=392823 RepID=A0ABP3JMP0_9BACI